MSVLRQKTRLDEPAPVLFQLPNLRARTSGPSPHSNSEPNSASDELHFRVDPPAAVNKLVDRETLTNAANPVDRSLQSDQANPANQTNLAHAVQSATVTAKDPSGRSWMERVGSRLILLVTLIVIVAAAWMTGQRIPAPKPKGWNDTGLSQTDTNKTGETLFQAETSSSITSSPPIPGPSTDVAQTPSVASLAAPTTQPANSADDLQTSNPPPIASVATIVAPETESKVESALQPGPSLPPVTSDDDGAFYVDPHSVFAAANNSESPQPSELPAGVASNESLPLAPPLPANSTSVSSNPSLDEANIDSRYFDSKTPLEPTFDPNMLVPWVAERLSSQQPRYSATPNPIDDWSRYLPQDSAVQQGVRSVSATAAPGGAPVAQQAALTSDSNANPYSR